MNAKRFVLLVVLAIALVAVSCAHADTLQHVADLANLLTDEQEASLNRELQAIYDDLGFDSLIITTNDFQGMYGSRYAAAYYESLRKPAQYPNGVALAYNPLLGPNGEIWEAARGTGEHLLGDLDNDSLLNAVRPYARSRDYAGMFHAYAVYLRDSVTPATPLETAQAYAPFGGVAGFIIGLISTFTMKAKLKTARSQFKADRYVLQDSLNVTQAHDLFLYETVVRRKIEQPRSGGGGSFRSSSGTSYSSRGGRL